MAAQSAITCQKPGEAEVFADAGAADDILLTFNLIGAAKTDRLAALIRKLKRMAVVLDNEIVARGLSEAALRNNVDIRFLVECDTGFGRNGVQSPQATLDLARIAMKMPRMQFEGLMTFPIKVPETHQYLERALQLFGGAGIPVPVVSGGGTPEIGEVVSVIPNHCCVVTNMVDEVHAHRGGKIETVFPVAARGKVR